MDQEKMVQEKMDQEKMDKEKKVNDLKNYYQGLTDFEKNIYAFETILEALTMKKNSYNSNIDNEIKSFDDYFKNIKIFEFNPYATHKDKSTIFHETFGSKEILLGGNYKIKQSDGFENVEKELDETDTDETDTDEYAKDEYAKFDKELDDLVTDEIVEKYLKENGFNQTENIDRSLKNNFSNIQPPKRITQKKLPEIPKTFFSIYIYSKLEKDENYLYHGYLKESKKILTTALNILKNIFNVSQEETCEYLCKKDWKKYLMGTCKQTCTTHTLEINLALGFIIRKLLQQFLKKFIRLFKIDKLNKNKLIKFVDKYRNTFTFENIESIYIFLFSLLFLDCLEDVELLIQTLSKPIQTLEPIQPFSEDAGSPRDSISSTAATVKWGGTRRKLKTRRKTKRLKYTRR